MYFSICKTKTSETKLKLLKLFNYLVKNYLYKMEQRVNNKYELENGSVSWIYSLCELVMFVH